MFFDKKAFRVRPLPFPALSDGASCDLEPTRILLAPRGKLDIRSGSEESDCKGNIAGIGGINYPV